MAAAKFPEAMRESQATTFSSQLHMEMWVPPTEEELIQLKSRKVNATSDSSESVLLPGPADGGDSTVGVTPLTLDQIESPRADLGQPKTKRSPPSITEAPSKTSEIGAECAEDSPGPDGKPV
jgi:hypothetical protein